MHNPYLYQVEPSQGADAAVVFVTGLQTEKRYFPWDCGYSSEIAGGLWIYYLRKAGWQGAIYHFWWDSCKQRDIEVVDWAKHKHRAEISGKLYLESAIAHTVKESSVSLFGHSLGARVIYEGFSTKSSQTNYNLKDVVLLGGAAHRTQLWECVANRATGKLFNVYNSHDWILNTAYKAVSKLSPCGLKPISSRHIKVKNINATCSSSTSHKGKDYLKALFSLVELGRDATLRKN